MLKPLNYIFSICVTKFITAALQKFKLGSGTTLPGKIARKITPDIFSMLVKQVKKEIITVTGTNGKTTSSGLIASILKEDGRKIVHNHKGANMLTGITASVVNQASVSGKLECDNAVFETDEAYLLPAFNEYNPDLVLVTNLFRDQLDRYGELNTIAGKIQSAVEKTSKIKPVKLILNADDPLVSGICSNVKESGLERIFYGFEDIKILNTRPSSLTPQETVNCPCSLPFKYTKTFYGHLGVYTCECGFKRTDPKFSARTEVDVDSSRIYIKSPDADEFMIKINLPGLYNCYNALSAAAVCLEAGISPDIIQKGIENYSTIFGRSEVLKLNGKDVVIQLIKNPVGATEVLRTINNDPSGRLLIMINDNYADGRDVSWLWDADFDLISQYKKTAVISGIRASDMAVRLKYAGLNPDNIVVEENIKKALILALKEVKPEEKLYVLPTYTALLELDKIKHDLFYTDIKK